MTCDVCGNSADVLIVQPGDETSDGPVPLCAHHLATFAVDLLASQSVG